MKFIAAIAALFLASGASAQFGGGSGGGIANGAVGTAQLANSSVDTTKLATDSVTTVKILAGAVDTNKLASDSVTTVKILNSNVTNAKLSSVPVSSTTYVNVAADYTNSGTAMGLCITNSSVTVTASGLYPLEFMYIGTARNGTLNDSIFMGPQMDGQTVAPFLTVPVYAMKDAGAAVNMGVTAVAIIKAPSAGAHTFCWAGWVDAGTGTWLQTGVANGAPAAQITIREIFTQ